MTKLKKAQNFIKENGIDSDEYVSKNIEYFMSGGDPDDNSISLYNEHQEMLKIIIEAGLKVGQIEPQVMQLLADRQVNIIELRHLLNKVKRVKIKEDVEQILINDLGETYDRIEDKNFINKYAGKITNIYEWCGDWWILEDDNYVITENCFEKLSK